VSTIATPRWTYTLTPSDLEWAARMIEGEGGDPGAVLWTMAQRFALLRGDRFPTFRSMLQAYSSPINPRYNPCSPADVAAHPLDCSDEAQARRARRIGSPPSAEALSFVTGWARGEVPNNVPRAVHFAVGPQVVRCQAREGSDACLEVVGKFPAGRSPDRQNWHATTPRTSSWPSDYVRVGGTAGGAAVAAASGAGLVLVALGAAGLWWASRRRA